MAVSIIVDTINAVAGQAQAGIAALTGPAEAVAGSLCVLAILALGLSLATGTSAFIQPLVRTCLLCAGTTWSISHWPELVAGIVSGAHQAVSAISGGAYNGPQDLFQLAEDTAARMVAESNGASLLSPSSIVTAFFDVVAAIIVWLGLSVVALMASLAEIELWLGASLAPLLLPFLALGATAGVGWGALNFMLHGSIAVTALGAISVYMSRAVTAVVAVPGTDIVMAAHQSIELMGLALLTALIGMVGYLLAGKLTGGSPLFSVAAVSNVVGAAQSAGGAIAAGVGGSAGRGGAAAAKGGSGGPDGPGPGGSGGGGAARPRPSSAGGTVARSSGTGSPFAA